MNFHRFSQKRWEFIICHCDVIGWLLVGSSLLIHYGLYFKTIWTILDYFVMASQPSTCPKGISVIQVAGSILHCQKLDHRKRQLVKSSFVSWSTYKTSTECSGKACVAIGVPRKWPEKPYSEVENHQGAVPLWISIGLPHRFHLIAEAYQVLQRLARRSAAKDSFRITRLLRGASHLANGLYPSSVIYGLYMASNMAFIYVSSCFPM